MTTRIECVDVCIVGSGAGGSVVAHHAAARGLRTLVLERGPRVGSEQLTNSELDTLPWLYKDGGMQFNTAMDLFVLQGSCVGGSTVLSNMVMTRPSQDSFRAWAQVGAEYDPARLGACFDEVGAELQLRRALDTSQTYLRWAQQGGARVLAGAEVVRLCHSRGLVDGVEVRQGRAADRLRVRARVVVVCAGAIGSSALLLRSGIDRNVGTRLSFNAGGMLVADFDQALDAHDADQMTRYLRRPGYLVELTHNPPVAAALTTPGWFHDHGRLMARSRHLAYAGALVPTAATGRVVWSRWFGHEETRFRMSPRELRGLKQGMRNIAEVFFEAGAKRVVLPTHRWCALGSRADLGLIDGAFSQAHELALGSAHPQGGNPISADARLGAVDPSLRVHGFENLFVCDASVFPSCIGVHPIHTIMALAKLASGGIVAEA